MKTEISPPPEVADEVAALIATLHETERRLEELTGGEVDTVSSSSGQPFMLRRAQTEMRNSEAAKQAAILNALPAHIALLDARGVIVSVNESWRQFATANFLQGPALGIGLNYLDVCDRVSGPEESDAHRTAAGIRAVLAGEKSFSIEYPRHSPTEQRWYLMTVTPLSWALARGAVVMHLNITERKLAENALNESETRYHSLFENMLEGYAYCETRFENEELRDFIYLEVNGAFEKITGLKNASGKKVSELIPGIRESNRELLEIYGRVALTGTSEKCEVHLAALDMWLSMAVYSSEKEHFVAVFDNITERKRSMEELRASEQRFKALFEQAAVGVAQADAATGRLAHVNQRFADIVGRSREELEQLTFTEITRPEDVAFDVEKMRQLKAGTLHEYAREKRYIRKDGSEVWVSLTVSAMWAPGEAPGLCIAVVQDITDRKRLDEHLLQAQKMEALGQFSGGVAHDFNNILSVIFGYTELARMTLPEDSTVREFLDHVLKASGRAGDLVKQILAFSRQQTAERTTIDLLPVVAESLKLLRATIPSTIEFETLVATDAPTVLANAGQVHQIIANLVINAWHAMKDRPGRLQVKLEKCVVDAAAAARTPRLRPGVYTLLSVSDTGKGMDAATLRRVFEPFFTTKPPGEGTGLGLAVVYGLMESHDGVITVHSQPGEGTVFRLYFPAHTGEMAVITDEEKPTPHGHGERVLVVDDEEVLAWLCQKTLETLGYAAEFATEPAAALAMLRAAPRRFALVITDQTMPGMPGLILASQLRLIQPGLPIILTTGYGQSLTPDRLAEAGIGQILLKPATIQSLGMAVHSALAAQPAS